MINPRITKRIVIVSLYLVIFLIVGILLRYFFAAPATCGDGKQNQSEAGIDCGGPCRACEVVARTQEIVILEKAYAPGGNGNYDAMAHVRNPNNATGAPVFVYQFILKDAEGKVIGQKEGKSFILPSESKYLAGLGIPTEGGKIPAEVEIKINSTEWGNLADFDKPELNIYGKRFDPLPSGAVGGQAYGLLRNESSYDLGKIFIVVVLRDQNGKVIGLNTTEKNTVRSKEERDFLLTWPYDLGAAVASLDMEAYSDMFDQQNFIRVR